jgi:endonuclease/exonuclease/phosphatase family metal-dependent hydrolase
MPVDERIRTYISDQLLSGDIETQLEIVIADIINLLGTVPVDAVHTSAYLSYFLSSRSMRSDNDVEQAAFAVHMTFLFRRLYNDATFIMRLRAGPLTDGYGVLLSFYRIHHAFTFNGLRSPLGPVTLDPLNPLRMLQIIVGAAYGPWSVHIRLMGEIRDYHHTRVRHYATTQHIEMGRLRAPTHQQFSVATWNMQGTSETFNTKWRTKVLELARTNDVVLIQEAGVSPLSARLISYLNVQDQFGTTYVVAQLLWDAGTTSRPESYHVFYLDVKRLRVSLAIVVAASRDIDVREVVVLSDGLPDSHGAPVTRPAFGVQIRRQSPAPQPPTETVTVFSFHAISGGGPNAPRMLREVSWHTETPYVLAGDFNRDPRAVNSAYPSRRGNWISPPDIAQLVMAEGPTHPGTEPQNMLDYAVTNGTSEATRAGRVDTLGPSDHLAVSYRICFP